MKRNITYKWGSDSLLIELGNASDPRLKALFWGEFLFITGIATVLLLRIFPFSGSIIINGIAGALSAALYMLALYRLLVRMFSSEKVLLEPKSITLIRKHPFSIKARSLPWLELSPLHYMGRQEKTAHPLKGNSIDYFGFDAHEQIFQKLHHEGNLYFYHEGYPAHFAQGVYSWHAEEMVYMMKLYAGDNLRLGPELKQILQSQEVDGE